MATAVTKSTITQGVWKIFRDRLVDNVKTVSISISPTTVTIQKYVATYNDRDFDSKSNLPILVIETPTFNTDFFTLGKTQANGEITLEIYTTQSESADKFLDAMIESIETYKTILASLGLHNIDIVTTGEDFAERGGIKVHLRNVTFKFVFRYTKTFAW